MSEVQAAGTHSRQFAIRLLGGFAMLALILAAVGIYGVLAYLVGQRTREIGIRIALGARRREVVGMVVGRALVLAAKGVALGTVASFVIGQIVFSMADMLFQVRPYDPWTLATVAVVLTLTAVAAARIAFHTTGWERPCVAAIARPRCQSLEKLSVSLKRNTMDSSRSFSRPFGS
jgi:predicted lysophospholipase L1 biosynthesis ABC-type transport system permease subunit